MLRIIASSLILLLCYFSNTFIAFAQESGKDQIIYQPVPDSPILSRNPDLTGEGEAFDFLIGD